MTSPEHSNPIEEPGKTLPDSEASTIVDAILTIAEDNKIEEAGAVKIIAQELSDLMKNRNFPDWFVLIDPDTHTARVKQLSDSAKTKIRKGMELFEKNLQK